MAPALFEIIDISAPGFDAAKFNLTPDAVNKHLHVRTPKGEMLKGVDAFAHIWSRLPRYRFASSLVKLPLVKSAADIAYFAFAEVRPWLPKKSGR